jgi:hypothetical protein
MKISVISFNIRYCDDMNGNSIAERARAKSASKGEVFARNCWSYVFLFDFQSASNHIKFKRILCWFSMLNIIKVILTK